VLEKFNFYDVYGYLLPGCALLMLLWIPFGIAGIPLKTSDWSSLIVAGAAAYLVGQLLQTLSIGAFPETVHDSGRRRYHSCIMLDTVDDTFTKEQKQNLAALVLKISSVDISVQPGVRDEHPTPESVAAVDESRSNAFLQCRALLLREKSIGYGEQYEGMLALMQGLSGALLLAFAYTLGWAFAHFNDFRVAVAHFLLGASLLVALAASLFIYGSQRRTPPRPKEGKLAPSKKEQKRRSYQAAIWGFAFALLAGGYLLGQTTKSVDDPLVIHKLLAVAVVCLIFFFVAQAYVKSFSKYYGEEIWRNILLCDKSCGKSSAGGAGADAVANGSAKKG
jgi:small neutral amino acid transporter SnatA (MarC family)